MDFKSGNYIDDMEEKKSDSWNRDYRKVEKKKEVPKMFYQVCVFPLRDQTHNVRAFVYKPDGSLIAVKRYRVKEGALADFLKKTNVADYKQYSTYNFDEIAYPSSHDVLVQQSELLCTGNLAGYGNYASF